MPTRAHPTRAVAPPERAAERRQLVTVLGRILKRSIARGTPTDVLFDDVALRQLLLPEYASRAALFRHNALDRFTISPLSRKLLEAARFLGVCVQGARLEPARGVLGLQAPGWVFDRILVVGQESGGGRVAAWVEGSFVHTDAGLGAVHLVRVEAPRRDHADLQLAVCDLAVWIDRPQDVVVPVARGY
ncbi:MAG: hypothetical protein OXU20_14135 [Myxococcales bacterium]|nr:hypothetical protein [Myxococcales bacterium]